MIFDPHTQTNLLPLHGYSHGPQIVTFTFNQEGGIKCTNLKSATTLLIKHMFKIQLRNEK